MPLYTIADEKLALIERTDFAARLMVWRYPRPYFGASQYPGRVWTLRTSG